MSFNLTYGNQGIWYGRFANFPGTLVTHGISTRFGGKSDGAFAGMNLAMHNGDNPEKVIANRKAYGDALTLSSDDFVTAKQVHGVNVLCVDRAYAGRGAFAYEDAIDDTDALITNIPGLPLMMFFADCVPVLIVDPVKKAIGISHAGWKGTVHKIAQKTIFAMQEKFGTVSRDCLVGIGPSIGSCCYEVGDEVAKQFATAFPAHKQQILLEQKSEKWKLDLWESNRIQLEEIGVEPKNIEIAAACTACNSQVFFSYRADHGKTGRIAATICLQS